MITPEQIEARAKQIGDRLVHPTVIAVQQGITGQQPVLAPSMNYRMLLYSNLFQWRALNPDFEWAREQVQELLKGMAIEELQREISENPNIN